MSNNGWIKLHRDLLDSKLWSCSDATLRVALYLILSANHCPKWHRGVMIERGQCVRSLTMISDDCALSRKAVRYALQTLKGDRFVLMDEPFGAQQGHRITICKYDSYQSDETSKGIEGSNEGSNAGSNAGNTNKNDKNYKNEKKESTARAPVARMLAALQNLYPRSSEATWLSILSVGVKHMEKLEEAVEHFLMDEANAEKPSDRPTAMLRGYIRKAIAGGGDNTRSKFERPKPTSSLPE